MPFILEKFLSVEAIEKLNSYYTPCPVAVINILKTLVKPANNSGCLLDNCAGTGDSAFLLAETWKLKPYLIEPHFGRFIACATKTSNSLCAYANQVVLTGIPTVWFFNPPFDPNDSSCSMEMDIMKASLSYACKNQTLCIILLPMRILENKELISILSHNLTHIKIRTFPAEYFEKYQQIVIFGYFDKNNNSEIKDVFSNTNLLELTPNEFHLELSEELSDDLTFSSKVHYL